MTTRPPLTRRLLAAALVAAALAGCAGPRPTGPSTGPSPSAAVVPPTRTAPATGPDGLLVGIGGDVRLVDGDGSPLPFEGPPGAVAGVTAAAGSVFAFEAGTRGWYAAGGGWTEIGLEAAPLDQPLVALDPTGRQLAQAVGGLQGRAFDLVILDLVAGTSRRTTIERGLDGPPAWIGPSRIGLHVLRADNTTGFAVVDLTRSTVADLATPGYTLAGDATGERVAFDDPLTSEALVGETTGWIANDTSAMARIATKEGPIDGLALDGAAARIALMRRTDAGATFETWALGDAGWAPVVAFEIPIGGPVSVAWLR